MSEEPRFDVEHYCACGGRMIGWFTVEAVLHHEVKRWGKDHQGEGHGPVSPTVNRKARKQRGMRS